MNNLKTKIFVFIVLFPLIFSFSLDLTINGKKVLLQQRSVNAPAGEFDINLPDDAAYADVWCPNYQILIV